MRKEDGKDCRRLEELISAYLDDELSATELVGMEAHLGSCSRCSREMDRLLRVKNALHQADPHWPKTRPSQEFLPLLMEKIRREEPLPAETLAKRAVRFPFRHSRAFAPLAAAAALVILLGGAVFYLSQERDGEVSRQAAGPSGTITLAGRDVGGDRAVEYLREHALESSQNLLMDDVYDVALVGYEQP